MSDLENYKSLENPKKDGKAVKGPNIFLNSLKFIGSLIWLIISCIGYLIGTIFAINLFLIIIIWISKLKLYHNRYVDVYYL